MKSADPRWSLLDRPGRLLLGDGPLGHLADRPSELVDRALDSASAGDFAVAFDLCGKAQRLAEDADQRARIARVSQWIAVQQEHRRKGCDE